MYMLVYGLSDKMMQRKDQPPKPVLTDEEALELGTTIMAEGLIYLIAACLVINEYNRRGNKASENEDQKKADIDSLRETVDQLLKKVEEQEGVIKDLVNKSADSNKIIETDGLPK
ncbi:hypothetical protein FQR65_LT06813 [Abscondita terminalis]|nr:hypothetical protein FQR65_LT06813 [Abscondita terminalis]